MMNDETTAQLHDYLDGLLDDAQEAAIEAQLAADPALREELEGTRALRAQLHALPRQIEPDRDLWPQIASRLDAAQTRAIDFGRFRARRRRPVIGYLVAAAALVLFALGSPYFLAPQSPDVPPESGGGVASALPDDPEFQRVAAQYLTARDELMMLLDERKGDIAPETYAVVEENLAVIASAVTEIQTALAVQPESEKLERMLYAAYRSEVNLLRQAVQLSDVPAASNPASADEGDNDAI